MIRTTNCCVLFADIVESTRMYETLGDGPARRLLAQAVERLVVTARAHCGNVVKTIGDEVMCTFADPNDAAMAARAMQGELELLSVTERLAEQINAHIGLHQGIVVLDRGDVFGDAVNVAARLVELAKPREIVTSESTVGLLRPEEQGRAHLTDQTTLRGKVGSFNIYELTWEDPGMTTAPLLVQVNALTPSRLRFWRGDRGQEVSIDSADFSIGRQPHNDFVVDSQSVSRTHARIEWRRNKYFLVDESTNGTYVCEEGSAGVWVWREARELLRSGTIGLGEPVLRDGADTLYYEIVA